MKEATVQQTGMFTRIMAMARVIVENPGLQMVLGCLVRFGLGVVLAGAGFGKTLMPLAVGMVAIGQSPLQSLSALLGSCLGYLYVWPFQQAVMAMATGVMVFATVCVMGGSSRWAWFMPAISATFSAMVGVVFLVQGQATVESVIQYVTQIAIAGGGTYCFQTAYQRHRVWAIYASLGAVVAGCCGFFLLEDIPLGQLVAYTLVAGGLGVPGNLSLAVVLALTLQSFSGGHSGYLLLLATAVSPLAEQVPRPLTLLAFVTLVTAGALCFATAELTLALVAAVAGCLALTLPRKWYYSLGSGQGQLAMESRLTQMAGVLEQMGETIGREVEAPPPAGAADIFEKTSKEVCENCVLWSKCWRQRSGSTYQALCQVARPMMERGALLEGDFPGDFLENCCAVSDFLTSVNDQLDQAAGRRQVYHRLAESRAVLGQQYEFLSKYFQEIAHESVKVPGGKANFQVQVAVAMDSGQDREISGDKGATFTDDDGKYYVLLCDGMGTGTDAAQEAELAVTTITGLLQGGLGPEKTLEILNGIYILRGTGTFSTVDLLAVDLVDGQATLYKWGGAPSYWKGEETKRIGTATPPPGLGVGESHKAQTIGLSLSRGETLILLTDGADHPKLGRQLEDWKSSSPEELVKSALAVGAANDGDDKTVVAVQLRPLIRH